MSSVFDKRFYRSTDIAPTGAGGIRLKHRELFLSDSMKQATERTVTDSRTKIASAQAALSGALADSTKTLLATCFKLSDPPDASDVQAIQAKLALIANGINGTVDIKVSVANPVMVKGVAKKMNTTAKALAPRVEGYVTSYGNNAQRPKGDIHVKPDYVNNNPYQAARTFIHEASHRFADTADFGEQGYMKSDGSDFRQAGISKDQCLNNADSYAYFAMNL